MVVRKLTFYCAFLMGLSCSSGSSKDGGSSDSGDSGVSTGLALHFQSGFEEPGVVAGEVGTAKCSGDIQGKDTSVDKRGDWVGDLESFPIESAKVCYGGPDVRTEGCDEPICQRGIYIDEDPELSSNEVLVTWIQEPAENVSDSDNEACSGYTTEDGEWVEGMDGAAARKARAQMTLSAVSSLEAFSYTIRVRLGNGFVDLAEAGKEINWMTIGEYWNKTPQCPDPDEATCTEPGDRGRVTLNVVKTAEENAFRFGLKADYQDNDQPNGTGSWELLWEEESSREVPIETWFQMRVTITAGGAEVGHVHVEFAPDTGEFETLFDVRGATNHPEAEVLGITAINPIKLYTAGDYACALALIGKRLDAMWDDFVFEVPKSE